MLVLSRGIGQAFVVDEAFVFILSFVGHGEVTVMRTTSSGTEGVELTLRVDSFEELCAGVSATYIPLREGQARFGINSAAGIRIRRIDGDYLKATRSS